MEGVSHELEFCLAQVDDFEQVMSISVNIYNGLDYLPDRYHRWLKDPYRRVILAKKEGKVVALVSVSVVDDGHTALVEGLRVAPSERGQGIAGRIQRYALALIKSQFPSLEVRRYARIGKLSPDVFTEFRLICSQEVLVLHFVAEELQPLLDTTIGHLKASRQEWEEPIHLAAGEVKQVFLDRRVVEEVLPGGTIIRDWIPYKPSEGNLEVLLKRGTTWMADSVVDPTVLSLCSSPYKVPAGANNFRLNIDIFGKDFLRARSQFLAQLHKAIDFLQGPTYCLIYLDKTIWSIMHSFCQTVFSLTNEIVLEKQWVLEAEF
ncbi:histidine N-acetyltransferase [Hypanus sabinus]|uniref:histidine N-acetyltransferase n=1 Tax=Hypanus sabinus TaxID=79690 RepID=UPI0028C4A1D8|nr:histidine N-acetyltransferase [Hypanus sabinus]XP_059831111.1 histidine N-acetyltransferase [Hypanus sabinus]